MNKILIFILFILVIFLLYKLFYTDTFDANTVTKTPLTAIESAKLSKNLIAFLSLNKDKMILSNSDKKLVVSPEIYNNKYKDTEFMSKITSKTSIVSNDSRIGTGSLSFTSTNNNYIAFPVIPYTLIDDSTIPKPLSLTNLNFIISISFWMKNNNSDANAVVLQLQVDAFHALTITLDDNLDLNLIYSYTTAGLPNGNFVTYIYDQYTFDNLWNHVVIIFDNINKSTILYVNGQIMNTLTINPLTEIQVYAQFNREIALTLGASSNNDVSKALKLPFFNGNINNIRIYNRILDANDVFILYYN
jgi:hypothetical protein